MRNIAFSSLANLARSGMNMLKAGLPLGRRRIWHFIDSTFRDQVTPGARQRAVL